MRKVVSIIIILSCFVACNSNNKKAVHNNISKHSKNVEDTTITKSSDLIDKPLTLPTEESPIKSKVLSFEKSYSLIELNNKTVKSIMKRMSQNKNISSYQLMSLGRNIGGLITMYEATDSITYLNEAVELISSTLEQAKMGKNIKGNPKLFQDNYKGWVDKERKTEVPLFESRFLRYVAQVTYLISTDPNLKNNKQLKSERDKFYSFLKKNGWEKWYVRGEKKNAGCYPYLFRSRTHMASHWAIVALYLEKLSNDENEKKEYRDFLNLYNQQLKSNLQLTKDDAYIWNMTWDRPWPIGTDCNKKEKKPIIQDIDHGNHVVAYILTAYELGDKNWTKNDVQKLCNTVKYIIYDKKNERFNADLNGLYDEEFADGIRMSDGFQYLSRYDKEIYNLFEMVLEKQSRTYKFRLNEPQYVAERQYAKKRLKK